MRTATTLPDAPSKHQQVAEYIRQAVVSGELASGDRLPTVRALAEELGLAVTTVAKAYRGLERAAVIETRGRSGSFVTPADAAADLKAAAHSYVERARQLGFTPAQARQAVAEALSNLPT